MNKCALLFMLLSILPASAKMIAQDNEVYELKTKLEYAKDLAALYPDPGYTWTKEQDINNKLNQLTQLEKQKTTHPSWLPMNSFGSTGFGGFGSNINPNEKPNERIAREAHFNEIYQVERSKLENQLADLEKIPGNKRLHDLAKNNLEKTKEAYGKALMNYFELEKDLS